MASKIHISTARKMLDAGDPVDLWLEGCCITGTASVCDTISEQELAK